MRSVWTKIFNTIVQLNDGLTGRKVDLMAINDRNMTRKTPASEMYKIEKA